MGKLTRRSRGTGTIKINKLGKYIAKYPIGKYQNGTTKAVQETFSTKKEAQQWLKEMADKKKELSFSTAQNMTVEEYMKNWLYKNKINKLKPTSFDRLEQTLLFQVLPHIGMLQLSQLQSQDIQDMIEALKNAQYSHSTIKKAYQCCNNCFATGVLQHTMSFNPCVGVTIPSKAKLPPKPIQFYTEEEEEQLIETARSRYGNNRRIYRLGDIIPFAFSTGLRFSECLGLKWADIDWKKKTAFIHATRVQVKNRDANGKTHYIVIEQDTLLDGEGTKTKKSTRTIDLNDDAMEALYELYKITGQYVYIISNRHGEPWYPRYLLRMFKKISKAAGMPEEKQFGFHSTRHTFTSDLIREGVDAKITSDMLGHQDVSLTLNTYTHIINEQKRQAVDAISARKKKNRQIK